MAADATSEKTDVRASLVLLAVTVLALVLANSNWADAYKAVLNASIRLGVGEFALVDSLKGWIKNGLMAIFFVYVGLEIKYEFVEGALADRKRATLPFAAALGGILIPTLVYLGIAGRTPSYVAGWAIPSATDIAFAVGVVGLLGSRIVPPALKAFLLAVAVIDDLAAILIIAVGYSSGLSLLWLGIAAAVCCGLFALNRGGFAHLVAYLILGALLWFCTLKSGINPTLAGVIVALFIPLSGPDGDQPLARLMSALKYPVLFAIMPIFALANAGVSMKGLGFDDLAHPVTAGITLGLLVGKPVGITLAVVLAVRSGLARLPDGSTWPQMIGIACIAGIGFTMSLFIGTLAFGDGDLMTQVRLGVLAGSTLAAIAGVGVLLSAARRARP